MILIVWHSDILYKNNHLNWNDRISFKTYLRVWASRPLSTASTVTLHTPAVSSRVPVPRHGSWHRDLRFGVVFHTSFTFVGCGYYELSIRQRVVTVTFHDVTDALDQSWHGLNSRGFGNEDVTLSVITWSATCYCEIGLSLYVPFAICPVPWHQVSTTGCFINFAKADFSI
jgi:hypothetical protein